MAMRKSFFNLGLGVVGGCLAFVAIDAIRGESAAPVSQLEIASPAAVRPVSLASNTALPVGGAGSVDLREAAKKTVPAVVHVKTVQMGREYIGNPLLEFFYGYAPRTRETPQKMGIGSGVIVSEDGYIITNNHVIDKSDKITVTLDNKTEYEAKVIGTDPSTDIALLKVEANGLPYLEYANSDDVELGEWVLAVGNPYNLTSTVTAGIISAKARELGINRSQMSLESFLQTDAAVNPGNSGGALVNTKGELVGINTAIYSETGNFAGYSFAVPISIAGKVANDLKQYGTVQRAILGVQIMSVGDIADMLGYPNLPAKQKEELSALKSKIKVSEGACVADFADRSTAKEAGIEKGDVIVAVNGAKVKSANALQEQISKYRPGDKVQVTVDRNGSTKTFNVELRNAQGSTAVVKGAADSAEVLGAAFSALTNEQKRELGVSYGIEVTGLLNGKLKDAGIKKGFIIMVVNDQKISSPEQLEKIVDKVLKGNEDDRYIVVKGFYPNGRTKVYAIDLAE